MSELDEIYAAADGNYRESLRLLGDSAAVVQDVVDLYQRMFDIVAGSPLAAKDEHVIGVEFAMAARYGLISAVTDCLRCQLTDTFANTRMAIEQAAFAARVKRHPHMAKVWLDAGEDEASYEQYREKFKKLFPPDHALLKTLGERYDVCAKQTHPSIYAFAGRSTAEKTETGYNLKFAYFRGERDGSEPLRTFFWILQTHILIINVFREVLSEALKDDGRALEVVANSVEAKFASHLGRWADRIPTLRPLAK